MENYDEYRVKKDAETEWNRDPAIRAEFGTFECLHAYRSAEAKGLVKVKPKGPGISQAEIKAIATTTQPAADKFAKLRAAGVTVNVISGENHV